MNTAIVMGYGFLCMGTLVIGSNWFYALQALVLKRSTSFTLCFGGVLGCLGVLLSDIPNFYLWVPVLADFTIPLVVLTMFSERRGN